MCQEEYRCNSPRITKYLQTYAIHAIYCYLYLLHCSLYYYVLII